MRFIVRLFPLVAVAGLGSLPSQSARAQEVSAPKPGSAEDLSVLKDLPKGTYPALRCTNGELLQFAGNRIASIEGSRVTLKPGTYVIRIGDVPTPAEPLERRALIQIGREAEKLAGPLYRFEGEFAVGRATGRSSTPKESISCDVVEIWNPVSTTEAFEAPVQASRFGLSGVVLSGVTWERLKAKDKPKTDACVVVAVPEPAWTIPVSAELKDLYAETLMAGQKPGTRFPSRSALPAGIEANEMRVMLYQQWDMLNAMFTVSDATGRLLSRGHAFATIGKKRENDMRDFVGNLPCR